jgi:uncharacterized protein YyaL (SSP411 family)
MHTNLLINETSPYLLQHAHNPVNWYPWGEEALDRAKAEDKPILVSIGYAACHWCHVMERESFENEEVAKLMNDSFINIKIDREERPDLDHIYMDAVQTMTGGGGWPLNVFLTPDCKPFYGGTYFPPVKAFNRPSWKDILVGVQLAFSERRNEIEEQAEGLTAHLVRANEFGTILNTDSAPEAGQFTSAQQEMIFENLMKLADRQWGGFGNAPKFPQSFVILFLLRHYHFTGNQSALDQACLSLDKMIYGGIYDQLGGGFARYSTDVEWLVPHFEKMLYDNALLVMVMSEAFQITKKEIYKSAIEETIAFVKRELMGEEGGFLSALDADSEGEEGKYYVWSKEEADEILGEDAGLFCEFYNITVRGNWEGKNIPWVKMPPEFFAQQKQMEVSALQALLKKGREKLFARRQSRIRPQTDDKYLLSWNALMNLALSRAYAATGNSSYKSLGEAHMEFMLTRFRGEAESLHHAFKNGKARFPAFLDVYAFLISSLIALQEISPGTSWLEKARMLTEYVIGNFGMEEESMFYFTPGHQEDVIMRKREVYDGATPSGNAMMAFNLYYLSIVYDIKEWKQRSMASCRSIEQVITKYPSSFGIWATILQEFTYGTHEVVVVGQGYEEMTVRILSSYIPNKVFQSSLKAHSGYPLLVDKYPDKDLLIYYCRDYSCKNPVDNLADFLQLIEREQKT